MGIIGKNRRSLFPGTKNGVAKDREGTPTRSGGAAKDDKKRRFPASLFKRGRHSTASTLIDPQGPLTESNHSPIPAHQPVAGHNPNDCAFDQSCTSSNSNLQSSLAPFREDLFDSLRESILAVNPAYFDSCTTDATLEATPEGSPSRLEEESTDAASDALNLEVNIPLNNDALYEQSHHNASQNDTASSNQAQYMSRDHHSDAATGSDVVVLGDTAKPTGVLDIYTSDTQHQNNDLVVHLSPQSRSPRRENSTKAFSVPSFPLPNSSGQMIGTQDPEDILASHMCTSIGSEPFSRVDDDGAITLDKERVIESLRMELSNATAQKDALEAEKKVKDSRIQHLELYSHKLDQENEGTYQDYINLQVSHDRESDKLAVKTQLAQRLQCEVILRNEFIHDLSQRNQQSQQQKSVKDAELEKLQTEVTVLQEQKITQKEQIETMQENFDQCRDALRTKDERIAELEAKVDELVTASRTKDGKIDELRQSHANLETENGYHQRYINNLTGEKANLSTRVDGQRKTVAALLRMDGKRQYEIRDLYHGYACLCVEARKEPISKDVFKTASHATYEEDHPVDGPGKDSSVPEIQCPRPIRPNPTWLHEEIFNHVDLD